jgi:hypothetical protein
MRLQSMRFGVLLLFIFQLFDSLMDSPPNYEEMFTETQVIILFSILLVSFLQCSPPITADAGKVHDFHEHY